MSDFFFLKVFLLYGIICSILIYYLIFSSLLDFELLHGYWKKENPKIELFPPLADLALNKYKKYI